jgi:outer membrane lipoprotein-sorting protein
MTFTNMQVNTALTADAFRFTPPKGVDVVQAP